jgi:hypothetical protein
MKLAFQNCKEHQNRFSTAIAIEFYFFKKNFGSNE